MIRRRQRGQITPLILFAVITLIGAVALVIDAGVFFVTQRQLQTAVDAAALEAVWYAPACTALDPLVGSPPRRPLGCQDTPPVPCSAPDTPADCAANAVFQGNLGYAGKLCSQVARLSQAAQPDAADRGLVDYTISVTCDAPYWFANIFPNMPTMEVHATASATIGFKDATNTQIVSTPIGTKLVSRLVN